MKVTRWIGGLLVIAAAAATAVRAAESGPRWSVSGVYVEACTCGAPCGCLVKGEAAHGCQGLNVWQIDSGRYGDVSLSGVRLAVGHQPGAWGIYYFAPGTTEEQQKAIMKIMEPRDRAFGLKLEGVKTAPIEIGGKDGRFQVKVGEVGRMTTEPILGLALPDYRQNRFSEKLDLQTITPETRFGNTARPDRRYSASSPRSRNLFPRSDCSARCERPWVGRASGWRSRRRQRDARPACSSARPRVASALPARRTGSNL